MSKVRQVRPGEQAWLPPRAGVRMAVLRHDPSGWATTLLQFDAGARSPTHVHPGGEELYVLQGAIRVGDRHLTAGDYLYTPPGGQHDAEALEETLLFLIVPGGAVFQE